MKTIVVAEDDRFLSKVYGVKLKKEGYDVHVAENGVKALEAIKERKPQLVLLDVVMPEMDGFQVREKMNEDAEMKKIPTIFLTQLGQPQDEARGMELGAVEYLVKTNVTFQEVLAVISKLVG